MLPGRRLRSMMMRSNVLDCDLWKVMAMPSWAIGSV